MNFVDLITKKKNKEKLSDNEYKYIVESYTKGLIPDYQMSALLMAIVINDMDDDEIFSLTKYMVESGEKLDLSSLGVVVDKHSTGGVGDKTTLIIAPLVASCGAKVAKMIGRALGYTGGTIDKLEAIPNIKLNLTKDEFINQVKNINLALTSQTENIALADKKIYALRDVTGCVESIPLIASSIMSKKIAMGASKLVLDIKIGDGALIKNIEDGRRLARIMKELGKRNNIDVVCLLTNMNIPLGNNIGNALEVQEAMDILSNKVNNNLKSLSIELATYMVKLGLNINYESAKEIVISNLENMNAYNKFLEWINYQQGNINLIPKPMKGYVVKSPMNGYLSKIDALSIGKMAMQSGAGRVKKDDPIDYTAGVVLNKQINDSVLKDDVILTIYTNKNIKDIEISGINISNDKTEVEKLIYEVLE